MGTNPGRENEKEATILNHCRGLPTVCRIPRVQIDLQHEIALPSGPEGRSTDRFHVRGGLGSHGGIKDSKEANDRRIARCTLKPTRIALEVAF